MAATNVSGKLRRLRRTQYITLYLMIVICLYSGFGVLMYALGAAGLSNVALLTPVVVMQLYESLAATVGAEVGRRALFKWGVAALLPFAVSAGATVRFRKCGFLFVALYLLDAIWLPVYFPETYVFYLLQHLIIAVIIISGAIASLRYQKIFVSASLEDRVNSNVDRRHIVYDSEPIRKAGADNMPAIMDVTVFGKQMVYRRRKNSYELVVDGELYDAAEVPEGKPHRLMVNLDGNRYRLRFRRNGYCFLTGNGILLAETKLTAVKTEQ